MDPRERADAALARARARGRFVVTPDDAVSPMDAASTLQIPRAVVNALDSSSPDNTMVIAAGTAAGQPPPQQSPPHQPQPHQPSQQQPAPQQHTKPLTQYTQPIAAQQQTQPMPNPQAGGGPPTQPVPHPGTHPPTAPVPPPARQPEQAERHQQQQQQQQATQPQPQPRDLGGLVPTVQQPGTQRSMLSRRLDGN